MADDDGGVGYGRPPRHTQFQKGQSGNPQGRPRGTPSIKADLAAALGELIDIKENGRTRTVTKQRAVLDTLISSAIADYRAMKPLLDYMRYSSVGLEEQAAEGIDLENLDLLRDYLREQRKIQSRITPDANSGQPNKGDD